MRPPTTFIVPDSSPHIHSGPATGSTPCHSPASVRRWTIPPCASQLACVSVHRLSAHMSVSVARQSQSIDITVCLVTLALVAIHDTTRSTIRCVVPLSARTHGQLVSSIPCARAVTSGRMARRRCHGRGIGASLGMLPVRTHTLSSSKPAVFRRGQRRGRRRLKKKLESFLTLFLASTSPHSPLLHHQCGESMPWIS